MRPLSKEVLAPAQEGTWDLIQGPVGVDKAINDGLAATPGIDYAAQQAEGNAGGEHSDELRARAGQHDLLSFEGHEVQEVAGQAQELYERSA